MSDRADELLRDVIEHWMIAYDPTELTKACERARAYLSENQPINDAAAQRASAEVSKTVGSESHPGPTASPHQPIAAQQKLRERFNHWYTMNAFDLPTSPLGSRDSAIAWSAWVAATLATPQDQQTAQPVALDETLRGFAAFCESASRGDGIDQADCLMLATKFREAAELFALADRMTPLYAAPAVQPIPRDPTQAMMEAGWKAYYATPTPRMIGPIWIAMHDAFTKGSGGE